MRGVKILLESLGIKIDAKEIESAWAQSKDALPRLATAFDEMSKKQTLVLERMDAIDCKIDLIFNLLTKDVEPGELKNAG